MSYPPSRRRPPVLVFVLTALGVVLLMAGAVTFGLTWTSYTMPSAAMENTLAIGDTVYVDRSSDIRRGDLVVFRASEWNAAGKEQIKRVIGVGGDRVVCCDAQDRITVNGKPLTETYLYSSPGEKPVASDRPFTASVPPGRLWVMGDHRLTSADSRHHLGDPGKGTIAEKDVTARVFAVGVHGLGTADTFTENDLADPRSLPPSPVIGLLVAAAGLLTVLAAALAALLRLRRPSPLGSRPAPS